MEERKIIVGITHGDINGVGYEVILKAFSDPTMLDLCTPVIYGSPKVAAYHRKAMDIQTNFSIINSASEAQEGRVNIVNCTEDELKVELAKPTQEAGRAALAALEMSLKEYREGLFDVLVTAPINKHTIQSENFHFPGHTEYIEERVGNGQKALMILLKDDFRVALVTGHVPVSEISKDLTQELIMVHQVNHELENYAAVSEKIAEDKERKRLAREIHDTLGHALTGIAAGVDACIAMIDINPEATKKQLMVISKVVRQGIVDVRNSLNKLRPGALEQHGFKGAIENMIEEFTSVSDLTISLDYRLDKVDFENTKEDILFRVIQESVTNAVRHGDATHIDISLYIEDNSLYLKIQDNGQGCEEIHYGFGLKQMKERLGMINGKVAYDGHHGFLTIVTIPLQEGELYD